MPKEKNLQLHFKEFIKTDPDHICDLLVYEPRNIEEVRLGTLFMLGKIENIPKNKHRNFDFLLNLLISVIKREFYSDYKRSTAEALEASLNKANLYLADFTEKGNVEWIGNLSFICGTFSENTLHVTQIGNPIIKLFRGTTISHIENKFPAQKKPRPSKAFSNIATGTILNGDKIIISTKDILKVVPLSRLKQVSKKNCDQIIKGLKTLVEKKADKAPVLCLILEAKDASKKILACAPVQEAELKENLISKKTKLKLAAEKTLLISRKIAIVIFLVIYKIIKLFAPIFKKIPKAKLVHRLLPKIQPLKTRGIILYKQNKPVFLVASFLVILILILPFAAAQKINYYVKINNFNKLSAEIQEVQKKTDAALIYQDKEKAKTLLQKNQTLLANLLVYFKEPSLKGNAKILDKTTILQEKHQEQQDSISNVIRIKELKEILDFSTSGFIVNPVGINKIKDNLYFYELDSGILYKFNLSAEENKGLALVFISAKDELRKMISLENGRVVLFGQSKKIYLYNSNTNDHNTYLLDPAIPVEQIKDVKNFLSNFYILNTEQGNIIKYSNELKGNNWLSESTEEFKNAQSMAIDGSIYVLNSDGIITRYFQGKKAEEIKPKLEKQLAGENKIFTGNDFKNLYLSDPKNKRVIVLNKQGELINQYTNDELSNLQDFWVTKDEKDIYLLSGKKVFKLEL